MRDLNELCPRPGVDCVLGRPSNVLSSTVLGLGGDQVGDVLWLALRPLSLLGGVLFSEICW